MVAHLEYLIPLPIGLDEYKVAQLYTVAEESKNETGGGEGITILKNEPYEKEDGEQGQYTHKVYSIASKVPSFVSKLLPKSAFIFHEKAWNSFPNCRTEYTNDYLGKNFLMVIISRHESNGGSNTNVDYGNDLINRSQLVTEVINICDPSLVDQRKYTEATDPTKYSCKAANRGPFTLDYPKSAVDVMCCYKYYYISCKTMMIGKIIEGKMKGFAKDFLFNFHRKLVCSMHEWYGKTMQDIRDIEERTKEELEKQIKEGGLRGTTSKDTE